MKGVMFKTAARRENALLGELIEGGFTRRAGFEAAVNP